MSSRHFKKKDVQGNLPSDESEEEYQPLYAQNLGATYDGLQVSSHSESERASERSEEDAQENASALPVDPMENKKKNLKKKGKGKSRPTGVATGGLDEVERSVLEVNALLGAPPPAPPPPVNQALSVLTVDPKNLNVANELKKIFGPEAGPENRRSRSSVRSLLLKRVLIHPNKETSLYEFNNSGLSMMKYKDKGRLMYFVFNHSEGYQKMHRNFLVQLAIARRSGDIIMNFDQAKKKMHVEALLEISDRLFRMEENSVGNEIVENVLTYLQYIAHPLFILSQNHVRLDYKFLENRPFHVAMLKYIYLLTNKACHRTALEITKMMLLLDPNDPLALLSVLDILALRCREHEWLIEAVKYFDRQREACLLFNIKYSNSLAHFHVAVKNKLDFAEADELIRDAILAFPPVLLKILECCNASNPELIAHGVFKPDPLTPWSAGALEVYMIYAKMTYPRWNEPAVMTWLMRNVNELCNDFNSSAKIRETASDWCRSRHTLFQMWPKEYLRHLSVFGSISKLIIDFPLKSSAFNNPTCAFDPMYDKAVNRYSYNYKIKIPLSANIAASSSPVYSQAVRHDYYRMVSQIAVQTGRYPFMYLTTMQAQQLNEAQFANVAPVARPAPDNRGVYFMPQEMPENAMQGLPQSNNFFPVYEQAGFLPGFNIAIANMSADYGTGIWNKPPGSIFGGTSQDWAFDDNDEEFTEYDYDDDPHNFARDENDMARAMAAGGNRPKPKEDEDFELSEALKSVYLDLDDSDDDDDFGPN